MAKKDEKITCNIEETYGVLSDTGYGTKKVFAKISWNGGVARPEIRTIRTKADGEEVVGKGISLNDAEMDNLMEAYRVKKKADEKNRPVDFQNIFNAAPDIVDKREDGYVTKDGYIELQEVGELAERAKAYKNKNP